MVQSDWIEATVIGQKYASGKKLKIQVDINEYLQCYFYIDRDSRNLAPLPEEVSLEM